MTRRKRNQVNVHKSFTTKIPSDGTAVEIPVPKGLKMFFSEDGKLMAQYVGEDKPKKEGKPIEYKDIAKKLFLNKNAYFICGSGVEKVQSMDLLSVFDEDNSTSLKQAKKMLAYNKLMNIAKYLNRGWKQQFSAHEKCWLIVKDECLSEIQIKNLFESNPSTIVFKDEKTAKEAIRIMGEESLNDLFSTDW